MSEPLSTNETPAPAGEEMNWGDPAPEAAPEAAPSAEAAPEAPPAPAEAAPEPEAAPAEAPPPTPVDDFAFLTLQNGEKEVRLSTGEVYRGKDESELMRKMAMGKIEANRYISQLKSQAPPPPQPQPVTPPVTNETTQALDPATIALADMMAPALGLKNGQELVQAWQQMNQKVQSYEQQAAEMQQTAIAGQFIREAGDFVVTPGNIDRFSEQFDKTGLPFTKENALLVHNAMKGMGAYEKVEARQVANPAADVPRAPDGKFAPRMPLPPAPSSPAPAAQKADVWAMTDDDFAKFMQEGPSH